MTSAVVEVGGGVAAALLGAAARGVERACHDAEAGASPRIDRASVDRCTPARWSDRRIACELRPHGSLLSTCDDCERP